MERYFKKAGDSVVSNPRGCDKGHVSSRIKAAMKQIMGTNDYDHSSCTKQTLVRKKACFAKAAIDFSVKEEVLVKLFMSRR